MNQRGLALVIAGVLFGPVLAALAWPVPTDLTVPLEAPASQREAVPLELGFPTAGPETRTGGIPMSVSPYARVKDLDGVALLTATFDTAPTLEVARLGAVDGTCEFRSAPGATLPNNGLLLLEKAFCNPTAGTRDFMLWMRLSGEGRAAVWTYSGGTDEDPLVIGGADGARFAVRGEQRINATGATVRRVDLVAYLWQRDGPTIWFWCVLMAAIAGLGAFGLATTARGWAVALGAGALAFAVSGAWSIVMPPLQGADEPDHLLSFSEVVHAPQVESTLPWLARRTHFERLRFRGDQHFRAADIDRPYDPAWTGDIHSERMDRRSAVAPVFWRAIGSVGARALPLPDLLLAVRLANAVLFGIVAGLATWIIWWGAAGRIGVWSLVGLAVIPTLPYFSAMVSDWALVASWSALLAAGLLVLQHDGPRAPWAGLVIGLATALLFGTSVSAFLILPLLILVCIGRIVLGGRQPLLFWGGLAVGAAATGILARGLFLRGFARYDAVSGSSADLLNRINHAVGIVADAPWLLVLPAILGLLAELAWHRAARAVAAPSLLGLARPALAGMTLASAVMCLLSLGVALPTMATWDSGDYAGVAEYGAAALSAILTMPRLAGFDHLTFTTFVSGFGWIDAILPGSILAAICLAGVAALWASGAGTSRQTSWLLLHLAALIAAMGTAAVAAFLMRRNLHGRYVLSIGVPITAVMFAGAGRWLAARPARVRELALLAIALLHGLSLALVTTRYF